MSQIYYANGTVAVLSNKLFTLDKYNRLAESATTSDALKVLYESQYGRGSVVDNPNDFENILQAELHDVVETFRQLSVDSHALNYFTAKYDYLNAKALAKCKYARTNGVPYCFACSKIPPEAMQALINKDDYTQFSVFMAEALRSIDSLYVDGVLTPQQSDMLLDIAMFKEMRMDAKKSSFAPLRQYFSYEADATNILTMFRAKKNNLTQSQFAEIIIEGGSIAKEQFLALFIKDTEVILRDFMFTEHYKLVQYVAECYGSRELSLAEQYVNKSKQTYITKNVDLLSMQPLLQYYINKTTEIDKIRYIVICIKNGVASETIKERLKQLYA